MSFERLIPPSKTRFGPRSNPSKLQRLTRAIRFDSSLSTTLLIGATIQCILILIFPRRYAMLPALLLITLRIIDTALITFNLTSNPYLRRVIFKKSSPQVLSPDSTYAGPGKEKVAIFLLGAKSNHPLGSMAPGFPRVGQYFRDMMSDLKRSPQQDTGFLGVSYFTQKDPAGRTMTLTISYWRSIEHVHAYAHESAIHRAAWQWWDKTIGEHAHIGIMHEIFEAPAGMWESIYVNFQPVLMGGTTYLRKRTGSEGGDVDGVGNGDGNVDETGDGNVDETGDGNMEMQGGEVKEEWVSGLLNATRGPLRTSNGRRGLADGEMEKIAFATDVYS